MSAEKGISQALELIEQLHRLSEKLDVAAERFKEAEENNMLLDGFFGEIFITVDVAEDLDRAVCELDEWARENGGPKVGRLTDHPAAEGEEAQTGEPRQ